MGEFGSWRSGSAIFVLCATTILSGAQTFTSLHSFHGRDGGGPWDIMLAQGLDGNFYGTTIGVQGNCIHPGQCGTVFKINRSGALTTLYGFCAQAGCTDGIYPEDGLVLASDGNFYGTTWGGGANGKGTVFRITANGKLTTLYSFCSQVHCPDGANPVAGLTQAADGNLYGSTYGTDEAGGTIFKISLGGTFTTLHVFHYSDGADPYARLVQGSDGNFYGSTTTTIFKLTPLGVLTTLHRFSDGSEAAGSLAFGVDGNLYGTTIDGGEYESGSIFKIDQKGAFTTLYSFCGEPGCQDGYFLVAGLTLGTDGTFYGVTEMGGDPSCSEGCGTIFGMTPAGALTTLHAFDHLDGNYPMGNLLQGTDGVLYGTTYEGGNVGCGVPTGCGTVFSLNMGLAPFVTFVRPLGKVGQAGEILGQGFTGTTSVLLNGTPASFTVVSDTFIRATVPVGATTGYVTVTTPTGTLTSNVPFRVIK